MAEWEEMKQMSLIEMDGFLKGKCIPRDLKVNETNAEYIVRKFGELESKLNEQREYYEGVIADGSKRIAELEAREIKPAKGEVLVVVSGFTGCGKSAIAGEIEIAMKAIGVPVQWTNGDAEKRMTGADWLTAIEMYKPTVRIVEVNVPRVAGIKEESE
ncbi:ead/Ea22-like family protein [Escherichia coli]|uniref:ead/Ea22-like family protein n=1 Tax=Escherichia coli TaxID=562 RepID=UPI00374DEA0A